MERMLYCRGYCLLDNDFEYTFPSYYESKKLDNKYSFHFDPVNKTVFHIENNNWIILSGIVIDTLSWTSDLNQILSKIKECLFVHDKYFLEYLDHLAGRFIIAYCYNEETHFYTDACGMKSAFYNLVNKVVVSSHQNLVKQITNSTEKSYIMDSYKQNEISFSYGYPGRLTPHKNIYQLTPNTRLNLSSKKIERFFPRENIVENKNFEKIAYEIRDNFNKQIDCLSEKYRIVLSLTAGYDSRFTLACLNNKIKDFLFFTYKTHDAHTVDLNMSQDIAEKLELNHKIFYTQDDTNIKDSLNLFKNIISKNSYYFHNLPIAHKYWLSFMYGDIHIRSNLAEIGRLFYGEPKDNFSAENMIELWAGKNVNAIENKGIKTAFEEFYITTDFDNIYNYNPHDMFYWEHRMGIWLSQVLVESDPAFDTIILFNCRSVLCKLLSVPTEHRKNNTIFQRIINDFLPELKEWPINPIQWPK